MPSADSRERLKKNQVTQMAKTLDPKILAGLSKMNKANESETRRLRNAAGRRLSTKKPTGGPYRSSEQKQERGTINPSNVGDTFSKNNPNSVTNKLGRSIKSASKLGSRMGEKLRDAETGKKDQGSYMERRKAIMNNDKLSYAEKIVEFKKLGMTEGAAKFNARRSSK